MEEEPLTLGGTLFEAREAHGLTIEQVAAELRVETPLLEALEEDRLEVFAAPVFIKGYLRNLAERYELDQDNLLEKYAGQRGTVKEYAPVLYNEVIGNPNPMLVPLGIAGAILIIGIPALWFTWNSRDSLSEIFSSGPETSISSPVAIEPVVTEPVVTEPVVTEDFSTVPEIDPAPPEFVEPAAPGSAVDAGPLDNDTSPEPEQILPTAPEPQIAPLTPPAPAAATETGGAGSEQAPTDDGDGPDELVPLEDTPAAPSENTAPALPVDAPAAAPQEEETPGAQ